MQGNLDPAALTAPWERRRAGSARRAIARGRAQGHIFNLGHGVLPETDPASLTRLVELVHERTEAAVAA